MIEEFRQEWDFYNWVNDWKITYNPDGHKELEQSWDGSNWMNEFNYNYTYDVNNNVIEMIRQEWDITNWVNDRKWTYSYIVTEIEHIVGELNTYSLLQNYPNPFNPSTTIQYSINDMQFVRLKVYDVLGNEVATLVNEEKSAGTYDLTFYAGNLSSGTYFYQLRTEGYVETKKMLLLR
jgi:hypothetical protein